MWQPKGSEKLRVSLQRAGSTTAFSAVCPLGLLGEKHSASTSLRQQSAFNQKTEGTWGFKTRGILVLASGDTDEGRIKKPERAEWGNQRSAAAWSHHCPQEERWVEPRACWPRRDRTPQTPEAERQGRNTLASLFLKLQPYPPRASGYLGARETKIPRGCPSEMQGRAKSDVDGRAEDPGPAWPPPQRETKPLPSSYTAQQAPSTLLPEGGRTGPMSPALFSPSGSCFPWSPGVLVGSSPLPLSYFEPVYSELMITP